MITKSLYFQLIPTVIQFLIGIYLLNICLQDTKPINRWIFIIGFVLSFFTTGTGWIESFVNYPMWLTVGEKNWHPYLSSITTAVFFGIFLIPGYLPLFLSITLFWRSPQGILKYLVTIFLPSILYIFGITAAYFVPDLQLQLDKGYSKPLIEELMWSEVLYRNPAGLIHWITMAWMFLKIGFFKIRLAS